MNDPLTSKQWVLEHLGESAKRSYLWAKENGHKNGDAYVLACQCEALAAQVVGLRARGAVEPTTLPTVRALEGELIPDDPIPFGDGAPNFRRIPPHPGRRDPITVDGSAQPPTEDRRDAERYRWMRDEANQDHVIWERLGTYQITGEALDSEVDAARGVAVTKSAAPDDEEETPCPKREDGVHCECWYEGKPCCGCGQGAILNGQAHPPCTAGETE